MQMLSNAVNCQGTILVDSLSAFLVTISYQYILSTPGHAVHLTDASNKVRVVQMRIE